MTASMIPDAVLSAGAVTTVILLLGTLFLLILQTPRFQYSLRFLVIATGCIAVALGLWTALWRTTSGSARPATPIQWDAAEPREPPGSTSPPSFRGVPGARPGSDEWNEYMDGPYQPRPQEPASPPPQNDSQSPNP